MFISLKCSDLANNGRDHKLGNVKKIRVNYLCKNKYYRQHFVEYSREPSGRISYNLNVQLTRNCLTFSGFGALLSLGFPRIFCTIEVSLLHCIG